MKGKKDIRNRFPIKIIPDLNIAKLDLEEMILTGIPTKKAIQESFKTNFPDKTFYKGYKKDILRELTKHSQSRENFSRITSSKYGPVGVLHSSIATSVTYPTMDEQEMEMYLDYEGEKEFFYLLENFY